MSETGTDVVVGIDVGKARLDVAVLPSGTQWTVTNTAAGVRQLVARLQAVAPGLTILEATGGYERALVNALSAASLPLVVANPRQVRAFARAIGQLAKTDRLDALLLARFGQQVRPAPRPLPDEAAQALDAPLSRRRQLVEMRTAETNRLHIAPPGVQADLRRHLRCLDRRLVALEAELAAHVAASPAWHPKDVLLQSVPGVGPGLSRTPRSCSTCRCACACSSAWSRSTSRTGTGGRAIAGTARIRPSRKSLRHFDNMNGWMSSDCATACICTPGRLLSFDRRALERQTIRLHLPGTCPRHRHLRSVR